MASTDNATILAFLEAACGSMGSPSAYRAARLLDHIGADLSRITSGRLTGPSAEDDEWARDGLARLDEGRIRYWSNEIERLASSEVEVITAGTSSYPVNLRLVPNRPPVLFVRGTLKSSDTRAIAVVGTRTASEEGTAKARSVAAKLAQKNVTVVSGLATGIDSAAHWAALEAGGRTLAVFGTGIDHVSPTSNRRLAHAIAKSGACISQWWPTQGPTKWTFPLRNIVTSGLSLGTVVVEAGETSGARLQANDARKHGRRLMLLEHLVTQQSWAAELVGKPGVHVVKTIREGVELVEMDLDTESLFSLA